MSRISLDRLTGLLLKKEFETRLAHEVPRALRYHRPLTLMIVEVEFSYFEKDRNLRSDLSYTIFKQLGPIISRQLRTVDFAGRISGDMFAAMLPETGLSGAFVAGERLRAAVENYEFIGGDVGERLRVALNVGLASFPEHGLTAEDLTSSAHKALLLARREGGNKAVVYPEKLFDAQEVFKTMVPVRRAANPDEPSSASGEDSGPPK